MRVGIVTTLCLLFSQQLFITKIEGKAQCLYYTSNANGSGSTSTTSCDDCCTNIASSAQTACCSSVSLSALAIPFFIVAGVCILGICVLYCRPLWKVCICGNKCPCESRARVSSPQPPPVNHNPVFLVNNDDLPDYATISKDTTIKDITPPPYNFVATHPNDFGIDSRVPSAPPHYSSRRGSLATTNPDVSIP